MRRLIKLLLLGGAAAWAYKRFMADAGAGREETEGAEPFSSEQLGSVPSAEQAAVPAAAGQPDPLTQPSWLDPADAG